MNKNCFFGIVLLMASGNIMADTYKYLTIECTNKEESISLPTISKITFNGGNCIVTTSDGDYTYPLSEMQKLTFTVTPTAIEALPESEKGLKFEDGVLRVDGNGMLRVYNAAGALVQMANVKGGAGISLNNLPKGLYIVSMEGKTIKLRK